jgi:hypothetical protein
MISKEFMGGAPELILSMRAQARSAKQLRWLPNNKPASEQQEGGIL